MSAVALSGSTVGALLSDGTEQTLYIVFGAVGVIAIVLSLVRPGSSSPGSS